MFCSERLALAGAGMQKHPQTTILGAILKPKTARCEKKKKKKVIAQYRGFKMASRIIFECVLCSDRDAVAVAAAHEPQRAVRERELGGLACIPVLRAAPSGTTIATLCTVGVWTNTRGS